ncbi:effector-associated constant component EACC1 [Streptomyces cinerochromogenes]|uniref:effector-associated constant component EACC1 n=1 Tax=Streptomyces cinerochromogenes TaxID=66422 RepID=UPI0033A885BE
MTDLVLALGAPPGDPRSGPGSCGTEDDLRSLLRWLSADDTVPVRGRIVSGGPPVPGGMGSGFDLLQLAVSSGLSVGSLVVSVLQWQAARRDAPAVTLRRGDVEVVLSARAARDEETVRGIVDLLDGTPPSPSPPPSLPRPRAEEPGGDDGTA